MNDETTIQSLVEIPPHDALSVFATARKAGVAHPIDPILARVRSEIDDFQRETLDVGKPDDRRRIGRMAYRVAQSKSALKKVGDDLAKEAKVPVLQSPVLSSVQWPGASGGARVRRMR